MDETDVDGKEDMTACGMKMYYILSDETSQCGAGN
jgi:hypothetical protein